MHYLGFLCLGLGILSIAISLLCAAIAIFSKERLVKQKAKRFMFIVLPIAVLLLIIGFSLIFRVLSPIDS